MPSLFISKGPSPVLECKIALDLQVTMHCDMQEAVMSFDFIILLDLA